ncbi:MAG: hypothetical protein AABW52_03090 [Nanoarchaeota archaeon]
MNNENKQILETFYNKIVQTVNTFIESNKIPERLKPKVTKQELKWCGVITIMYPQRVQYLEKQKLYSSTREEATFYPNGDNIEELFEDGKNSHIESGKPIYTIADTFLRNESGEVIQELERILQETVRPTLERLAGEEDAQ